MSNQNVAAELKGNTLRVYWYLVQCSGNCAGPRQIQRELGFKSPALAAYHLDKLLDLGLVQKTKGEYAVKEVIEVGVLKQFMKVGSFMIPRYITYATMISVLFVFFLVQFRDVNFYSIYGLIFGGLSTAIFWYETFRVWQTKP